MSSTITQKELKKILYYNSETGTFIRLNRSRGKAKKGELAGYLDKEGYIRIKIGKTSYKAHRLAWCYIYGYFPPNHTDHINHNKADNRSCNLREVTSAENQKNTKIRKDNKSGVIGVYWRGSQNRWTSSINISGRKIHLGSFVSFHEAVNARKLAEVAYGYHENHGKEL